MLGRSSIVAFVPTTDYVRARAFYCGKLGLVARSEDEFALVLDANGNMVRVTKVRDWKPAMFTILGWQSADIRRTVTELQAKGVAFERYGWATQDELGVWTAPNGDCVAWFKDPDGNILSISQHL